MNRHQKQKSREIKDIMRADKFGRRTYKEAKRAWKTGIRAFPIGPNQSWRTFHLARLRFNRERLRELGQAVYMLMSYATGKGMEFTCEYWPWCDSYRLKFSGKDISGKSFCGSTQVGIIMLRQFAGPLQNLASFVAKNTDCEIKSLGVTPVRGKYAMVEIPNDRLALTPVEPILGKFIERDDKLIFDPTIERRADGSFSITEVSLIEKR